MDSIPETSVFSNKVDQDIFSEWLDMNDSITPHFISRKEFNNKWEIFLIKNIKYSDGKSNPQKYDLYIPKDFKIWEIIFFIDKINQEIGKDDWINRYRLSNTIKTQLAYLLKEKYITEDDIKHRTKKYHISNEMIQIIRDSKITTSWLRSIYKKTWINEISEWVKNTLLHTIDTTFFEKWTENLYEWMKTFTQDDREKLPDNIKDKDKARNKEIFDKEESNLSEKIGINNFLKRKLEIKDMKDLENLELEAAKKIFIEIYKYSHINSEKAGYSIKNVLTKKETNCVTKSILIHIFLKKLWIKHFGMESPYHVAIQADIGGKEYLMDATNCKNLINLSDFEKEKRGEYTYISNVYKNEDILYQIWDPIDILKSHMCFNKWYHYFEKWDYNKTILFINKAIELNPNFSMAWWVIWGAYMSKWMLTKGTECLYKAKELNPDIGKKRCVR